MTEKSYPRIELEAVLQRPDVALVTVVLRDDPAVIFRPTKPGDYECLLMETPGGFERRMLIGDVMDEDLPRVQEFIEKLTDEAAADEEG